MTRIEEAIKKSELEDTQNMTKEIEDIKQREAEEVDFFTKETIVNVVSF